MRWLFTVAAVIAVPVATVITVRDVTFFCHAEKTIGRISSVEYRDPPNSAGRWYRPTFTFHADGNEFTVTPVAYTSECPGVAGDAVTVLYNPRDPSTASIDTFGYLWLPMAVAIPFGLVLPFGVAMLWLVTAKQLIEASDTEDSGLRND